MKLKKIVALTALVTSLSFSSIVHASVNTDYDTIYTTDYLNVREYPSVDSKIVTTLKPNTKLMRTASVGNWDTIKIGNVEYYVCNDFITMQQSEVIEEIDQIEPIKMGYLEKCISNDYKGEFLGNYNLTAYCSCATCCGVWGGTTTASGTIPTAGRTVACNTLPFGTKLLINGHIYTVEDTGGMSGNVIDIYMDNHSDALNFGIKNNIPIYKVK